MHRYENKNSILSIIKNPHVIPFSLILRSFFATVPEMEITDYVEFFTSELKETLGFIKESVVLTESTKSPWHVPKCNPICNE